MIHLHYIKRRFYKPVYLMVSGSGLVIIALSGCFIFAPSNRIEIATFLIFGLGLILVAAGNRKYTRSSILIAVWILALLLLRRFDLLSWLSFAGTLLAIGIVTLFN